MKKIVFITIIIISVILSACENGKWDFPDNEYSTVYFAYQTPVRTIVLGKDYVNDNTLDNQHKCMIMATLAGVYDNENDVVLDVTVDNSLCDSLVFEGNLRQVRPMPSNYYTLPNDMQIIIPKGKIIGGIEVTLTDAFFADTLAIDNNYVIPMVITSVTNADSVLRGVSMVDDPNRANAGDWAVQPKDYILYAIKYFNPYDAYYLRRGVDVVTGNGGNTALNTTNVYHAKYVENDQVCRAFTRSMNQVSVSLATREKDSSTDVPFELILDFDENGTCTVSKHDTVTTYDVAGNGKLVADGDIWGGIKRDVMHLQYSVDFGLTTHSFNDTLVIRDRAVKIETFTYLVNE
ncbi:MAG: DUF1735 domain-containing protein [Bacteroidales bacterium]|nr:DUF1735 domain-containing protein [Bacteroidales bacterium]